MENDQRAAMDSFNLNATARNPRWSSAPAGRRAVRRLLEPGVAAFVPGDTSASSPTCVVRRGMAWSFKRPTTRTWAAEIAGKVYAAKFLEATLRESQEIGITGGSYGGSYAMAPAGLRKSGRLAWNVRQ